MEIKTTDEQKELLKQLAYSFSKGANLTSIDELREYLYYANYNPGKKDVGKVWNGHADALFLDLLRIVIDDYLQKFITYDKRDGTMHCSPKTARKINNLAHEFSKQRDRIMINDEVLSEGFSKSSSCTHTEINHLREFKHMWE